MKRKGSKIVNKQGKVILNNKTHLVKVGALLKLPIKQ